MSETPAILIVDDQEKLLKLVILLMNRLGFPDVEGVTDAVTGLERMRQRRYALVISDLVMEPMDGLSFLREIRADDTLMNTPSCSPRRPSISRTSTSPTRPERTPSSSSPSTCRC